MAIGGQWSHLQKTTIPASGPMAIHQHLVGLHSPVVAMGEEQVKGVNLEEVERQLHSEFPVILSPVQIASSVIQIPVKPGLLGSGPLSHAMAAVQGCVVPEGKDILDSGDWRH